MSIADNIKALRSKYGISQEELAKIAEVSNKAVSMWETGRNEPRMGAIQRIADHFHILKSDIIEDHGASYKFNTTSNILSLSDIHPLPKMKKVPLLGTIACGEPILAEENYEGYVNCPEGIEADFTLRCKGDSMINARIYDGDLVFIRQQSDVDNGEIAAVLIGEEATLKRVYKEKGQITLMAENSAYKPFVYTGQQLEDVHILGKAVAFLSAVR